MTDYGKCSFCDSNLEPVMFLEEEEKLINNAWVKTKRKRYACSHLVCPYCGKIVITDGEAFSGEWFY